MDGASCAAAAQRKALDVDDVTATSAEAQQILEMSDGFSANFRSHISDNWRSPSTVGELISIT
jgi:hypothetical protein